jgi:dTDP-4-dehydrorhamnose reductase
MMILITGSNGLLGQKLVKHLTKNNIPFIATSKGKNRNPDCMDASYSTMDICSSDDIKSVFNRFIPTHLIHTAAMTNVDECEEFPLECEKLNVEATQLLFEAAQKIGAHFQLLSTDFVFDGLKGNYSERDVPNPLSVYARSKVSAENLVLTSSYPKFSIVRTIILYGKANNLSRSNIVCWAKEALSKGQPLSIIDDQFRAPTWADDLAWACISICSLNKTGLYHISGPETMSIYDLVLRIAKFYSFSTDFLTKTDSLSLNQKAKRPPKTGFDLQKAQSELSYKPKTLEETLKDI